MEESCLLQKNGAKVSDFGEASKVSMSCPGMSTGILSFTAPLRLQSKANLLLHVQRNVQSPTSLCVGGCLADVTSRQSACILLISDHASSAGRDCVLLVSSHGWASGHHSEVVDPQLQALGWEDSRPLPLTQAQLDSSQLAWLTAHPRTIHAAQADRSYIWSTPVPGGCGRPQPPAATQMHAIPPQPAPETILGSLSNVSIVLMSSVWDEFLGPVTCIFTLP